MSESSEFDKGLIDELEAELLNQYLNVAWLIDHCDGRFEHLGIHLKVVVPKVANPKMFKDYFKLATDIQVDVIRKENLDLKRFQTQLCFTVEEYNCIYQEMNESCRDSRYDFIKGYGYSISDLISILDQLANLKDDLEKMNDKEKLKAYKEILHEYIGLDPLTYGFKNPSLKQRIQKGKSTQGEYLKIVKAKKNIFFDILIKKVTVKNNKYKSVSQAVNDNIDEVMHLFQRFDEEWIKEKRQKSMDNIAQLHKDKLNKTLTALKLKKIEEEIVKLSTFLQQLDDGLSRGYPFETLDDILPYNTLNFDEILMRALGCEKSIKEQCIESNR